MIPASDFNLIVHRDDPPQSLAEQEIEDEGSGSGSQVGPIDLPSEPLESSFRIRIVDASQSSDQFTVDLAGDCGITTVNMLRVSGTDMFLSERRLYAVETVMPTAQTVAHFNSVHFIDPETLEVTYGTAQVRRATAKAYVVQRSRPNGGQWTAVTGNTTSPPIAYSTDVQLLCIIRVRNLDTGVTDYMYATGGFNATINGQQHNIVAWDNKYGQPQFSWSAIWPKYQDYDNHNGGDWKYDQRHDYIEQNIQINNWGFELNDAATVGVTRYVVDVNINGNQFRTPGKGTRRGPPGDNGISDSVMRIVRKGNYENPYLQWVASYNRTAWTYASHFTQQVLTYIGTDCADMCIGAYYKMGGTQETNPSANSIVAWAGDPQKDNFNLVPGLQRKSLADNIQRNLLQPGDLLVLARQNEQVYHHAVVYIGEKATGTLDGSEDIWMANWARGGDTSKYYQVTKVKLSSVLGAAQAAPYQVFTVVRLEMNP